MIKKSLFNNQMLPLVIQPSADFKAQVNSDILCEWLRNNLKVVFMNLYKHGAILFRGFYLEDYQDFEKCISYIVPTLSDYKGGDSPRSKVSESIYTSTNYPSNYNISLHNEKSYSNNYPSIVFFFCEIEPKIGGETPLLDGRNLYSLIDRNLLDKFSTKKIKYIMNLHGGYGVGKSWQECLNVSTKQDGEKQLAKMGVNFVWKEDGGLRIEEIVNPIITHPITKEKVFFCQADQWHPSALDEETYKVMSSLINEEDFYHNCCYGDNSPLEPEALKYIKNLMEKECISFPWQKGDLLVVDNVLTLHGRFSYKGERRILVALSDINLNSFPSANLQVS